MGIGQEAKQRFSQGLCETSSIRSVQNDQLPEQANAQATQWVTARDVQSLS